MITHDDQVQLAFAFEFIAYPSWISINILALAGHGLKEALSVFGNTFKAWSKEAGAQKIQASCRLSMARLLRRYGFTPTYQTLHEHYKWKSKHVRKL